MTNIYYRLFYYRLSFLTTFLLPIRYVVPSVRSSFRVRLFVCYHDISGLAGWIFLNISGKMSEEIFFLSKFRQKMAKIGKKAFFQKCFIFIFICPHPWKLPMSQKSSCHLIRFLIWIPSITQLHHNCLPLVIYRKVLLISPSGYKPILNYKISCQ